jgi:hypothetical protein
VTNPQDIADKLRELAARTAAQAREKRNPAIANQNPTRRRMNIAASMREDADRLDRLVMVLAGLADDHENGGAPEILAGVRNRAQVESLLSYKPGREPWGDHVQRLERIGIVGRYRWTEAAVWARSYLRPKSAVETQAERVRRMEAELIGMKLPGFFPIERCQATAILNSRDRLRSACVVVAHGSRQFIGTGTFTISDSSASETEH